MPQFLADIVASLTGRVSAHLYHLLVVGAGVGSREEAVFCGLGTGQFFLRVNLLDKAAVCFWASLTVAPPRQLPSTAIVLEQVLQPRQGGGGQNEVRATTTTTLTAY